MVRKKLTRRTGHPFQCWRKSSASVGSGLCLTRKQPGLQPWFRGWASFRERTRLGNAVLRGSPGPSPPLPAPPHSAAPPPRYLLGCSPSTTLADLVAGGASAARRLTQGAAYCPGDDGQQRLPRVPRRSGLGPERSGEEACPRCRSQAYLPKAVPREPQDFQGVVGPLASAVEFDVAGETFQLYLSKRE